MTAHHLLAMAQAVSNGRIPIRMVGGRLAGRACIFAFPSQDWRGTHKEVSSIFDNKVPICAT
jgi:hypothetical protein